MSFIVKATILAPWFGGAWKGQPVMWMRASTSHVCPCFQDLWPMELSIVTHGYPGGCLYTATKAAPPPHHFPAAPASITVLQKGSVKSWAAAPLAQPALSFPLSRPRHPHHSASIEPVPDAHWAPPSLCASVSIRHVGAPSGSIGEPRYPASVWAMKILSKWEGEAF